jgi:HD superfamily phosphohydrolase/class 3 adenylate cyclase
MEEKYEEKHYDVVHGEIKWIRDGLLTEEEFRVVKELMNSQTMRRMQGQKQLGLASYVICPGANHTRYDHSVGTMYLATKLVKSLLDRTTDSNLKDSLEKNRKAIILSALLHDIGNGPFPLVMNSVLKRRPEWYEELCKDLFDNKYRRFLNMPVYDAMGYYLVSGEKIASILKKICDDNDIEKIAEIVAGIYKPDEDEYLKQIVTGNLGVHKLDFLLRDAHFVGMPYSSPSISQILESIKLREMKYQDVHKISSKIVLAVDEKDMGVIESMLVSRMQSLTTIAYNRDLRRAEVLMARMVEKTISVIEEIKGGEERKDVLKSIIEEYSDHQFIGLTDTTMDRNTGFPAKFEDYEKKIFDAIIGGRLGDASESISYPISIFDPSHRYNTYLLTKPPREENPSVRMKGFVEKLEEKIKDKLTNLATQREVQNFDRVKVTVDVAISKTFQRDVYVYKEEKKGQETIKTFNFIFDKSHMVAGLAHYIFNYGAILISYLEKSDKIRDFFSECQGDIGKIIEESVEDVERKFVEEERRFFDMHAEDEVVQELNRKNFPQQLIDRFDQENIVLRNPGVLCIREDRWEVIDWEKMDGKEIAKNIYIVEKEGDQLHIYHQTHTDFRNTDHLLSVLYVLCELIGPRYYGQDEPVYLKDCRNMYWIAKRLDDYFEERHKYRLFGYWYKLAEDFTWGNETIKYPIRCSELYEDLVKLVIFGLVERRARIVPDPESERPFFKPRYDLRLHYEGKRYVEEYLIKNPDYRREIFNEIAQFLMDEWVKEGKGDKNEVENLNLLEKGLRRKEEGLEIEDEERRRIKNILGKNLIEKDVLKEKIKEMIRKVERKGLLLLQPIRKRDFAEFSDDMAFLHIDIVGSTKKLAAVRRGEYEDFNDLQDYVEEKMREVVGEEDYAKIDWSGDGALIIFANPDSKKDRDQAAKWAVETAIEIQKGISKLNDKRRQKEREAISVRIGINTEEFRLRLREIEDMGRLSFIGISVAGKFQKHCEPGKILISESTRKRLEEERKEEFESKKVRVKDGKKDIEFDAYIWKGLKNVKDNRRDSPEDKEEDH